MQTHQWSLHDAKNKLSAVIDAAQQGEAQVITRRGVPSAVVVSVEAFEKLQLQEQSLKPDFLEHLLSSPQSDQAETLFERSNLTVRDIDFNE